MCACPPPPTTSALANTSFQPFLQKLPPIRYESLCSRPTPPPPLGLGRGCIDQTLSAMGDGEGYKMAQYRANKLLCWGGGEGARQIWPARSPQSHDVSGLGIVTVAS